MYTPMFPGSGTDMGSLGGGSSSSGCTQSTSQAGSTGTTTGQGSGSGMSHINEFVIKPQSEPSVREMGSN